MRNFAHSSHEARMGNAMFTIVFVHSFCCKEDAEERDALPKEVVGPFHSLEEAANFLTDKGFGQMPGRLRPEDPVPPAKAGVFWRSGKRAESGVICSLTPPDASG